MPNSWTCIWRPIGEQEQAYLHDKWPGPRPSPSHWSRQSLVLRASARKSHCPHQVIGWKHSKCNRNERPIVKREAIRSPHFMAGWRIVLGTRQYRTSFHSHEARTRSIEGSPCHASPCLLRLTLLFCFFGPNQPSRRDQAYNTVMRNQKCRHEYASPANPQGKCLSTSSRTASVRVDPKHEALSVMRRTDSFECQVPNACRATMLSG